MDRYIETERLILRSPLATDAENICRVRNSDFVQLYNLYDLSTHDDVIREMQTYDIIVIEGKASGAFIGCIYVKEDYIRYNVNSVELAGWLDEKKARNGIMSEALSALMPVLFNEGYARLTARVFGGNNASLRLMERAGFIKEGYLPDAARNAEGRVFDLVLFSVTEDEYFGRAMRVADGKVL